MHLALVLAASILATPDLSNFQRVLLPLHGPKGAITRGSSGTAWAVEEAIYNSSQEAMSFYPYYPGLLDLFDPPEVGSLRSGGRLEWFDIEDPCRVGCRGPYGSPGAVLWIARNKEQELVAYDRIYETHSDSDNHGAVIPAVHEERFRTGKTAFIDIPVSENFRTTVRIYNLAGSPLTLTLRIFDSADATAVLETVTIPAGGGGGREGVPVVMPGYGQISIESLLPPATQGPLRVELEPSTTPALYWAFATVTSNSAQRVTILEP